MEVKWSSGQEAVCSNGGEVVFSRCAVMEVKWSSGGRVQ